MLVLSPNSLSICKALQVKKPNQNGISDLIHTVQKFNFNQTATDLIMFINSVDFFVAMLIYIYICTFIFKRMYVVLVDIFGLNQF